MQAVQRHATDGGAVLGICNGFQILCEAHLLPGALMRNAGLHFVSKPVDVTVERTDTPFTTDYALGQRLRLPVAHGEGRFLASDDTLRMLEAEGRVVLRYVADSEDARLSTQSERIRRAHRRHPERRRERGGHHAPPRARGRSRARADRRPRILHFHGRGNAAAHHCEGAQPMTIEKPSRNEDEYFAQQNAELLKKQREKLEATALEAERKSHYMKCPKDGYDLDSGEFHGVQIETCPHCGGMWLDAGELEVISHEDRPALMTRVLSEALSAFRGSGKKPGSGK